MAKAPKYDIDAVRSAAESRWKQILPTVGGVDASLLDGGHHPCPKCGGTDRFRMIDEAAGALLCGQCFAQKNGDGFAAVQWLTGCTFPEAIAKIADHLGIQAKGSASPEKDLEWRAWSGNLVPYFAAKRPGVTEESLQQAGARLARYKNHTVYALPIIGETLEVDRPVGWALLEAKGGTLPKYDKNGQFIADVKVKITYGSKPGFVGQWAIERLKMAGMAEVVWKVEGVTDLLALQAKIPEPLRDRHLVVTNSNGAGQHPKWMASALAAAKTYVLHDADQPGEAGAKVWAAEVARHGVDCGLVRLPYEVAETHGKDLRDWFNEGNTYDDLLKLAEIAEVYRPAGEGEPEGVTAEFPLEELVLSRLGLEVIYETATGAVRVFSTRLGKSSTFDSIAKLSKPSVIQAAGPHARQVISADPDNQTTFGMDTIREALAVMASIRRGRQDERGVGVWRGVREDGMPADSIILCNDNEGARWNGDRTLKRIQSPRVDGMVLDFGDGDQRWYDFDTLESLVRRADDSSDWRSEVVEEAVELFSKWRWRGEHDPTLVTGLVLSAWIQTIWAWRPMVVITGESGAGKSSLFEALAGKLGTLGIFGSLAMGSAKSSEAGVRQRLGSSARIPILDEFEKSKDRDAILQMFRGASRGDVITKGTAGQSAKSFRLQHIAWLAAIESGMSRQPDINRFVHLELLKPEKEWRNKLSLPSPTDLVRLGQKLLAIAIVVGLEARQLAIDLKAAQVDGADSRLIETYAVPAAVLACACGLDQDQAADMLRRLMAVVLDSDDEPVQADQDLLLEQLMESTVRCDHGKQFVVSRLYESFRLGGVEYTSNQAALQGHGLDFRDKRGEPDRLVVRRELVMRNLLDTPEWRGTRIDQLLLRLDGAARAVVKLNGKSTRCVLVPIPAKYLDSGE